MAESNGAPGSDGHTGSTWAACRRTDLGIAALLGLVACVLVIVGAGMIDPVAFDGRNFDVYLQGDMPRVIDQMTSRWDGRRTELHPLFPLVAHMPVFLLQKATGMEALAAIRVVLGVLAALWTMVLFGALRGARVRRLDAVVFTAVGLSGAASIFWLVVPETFTYGGISLLLVIAIAAWQSRVKIKDRWVVASGVASLGMTVTNASSALLLALTRRPVRRAFQIGLNILAFTVLVWFAERQVYPDTRNFLEVPRDAYYYRMRPARALDVSRVFFSHTAVAPRVERCTTRWKAAGTGEDLPDYFLSFQAAPIGTGGPLGVVATLAWAGLLIGGLAALTAPGNGALRFVLGASLLAQLLVQFRYGGETFLYGMHWWSVLIPIVALSTLGRFRKVALALGVVFVLAALPNNLAQWQTAVHHFTPAGATQDLPVNDRVCAD